MANLLNSESVTMFLLGIGLMSLAWLGRTFLKDITRHQPYYLIVEVVLSILFLISVLVIILALYRL